jgi:hypothetical protein
MDEIHEAARNREHKTYLILSPSSGPARHLMEFNPGQGAEVVAVEDVRIEKDNGSGRKIDAGCHSGGGEDSQQVTFLHHGLNQEFPSRELTAVMGRHSAPLKVMKLPVMLEIRKAFEMLIQIVAKDIVLKIGNCRIAAPDGCITFGS